MKTTFELIGIEHARLVPPGTDNVFLHLIQHAALLGLKDAGHLNEMEFRNADEALLRQYRESVKLRDSDP